MSLKKISWIFRVLCEVVIFIYLLIATGFILLKFGVRYLFINSGYSKER